VPLLSVQRYIASVFDGLSVPGQTKPLTAKITPPVTMNLDGPVAFVWGGSMRAERQAGPRAQPGSDPSTAGFKHLQWDVDVWLCYLTNPNRSTLDSEFPAFVDAVMAQIWSTPTTLFIDAQGVPSEQTPGPQGVTQILSVGERFRLEYAPVHAVSSQRMLYFDARLTLEIYEAVQA
jgi:hypothetical protein